MPQPIPPPIPSTTKTANCKPSTFPAKKKLKDAYTVSEMSTATGLKLAPKDTPQSVSVITRKQMDDLGATTLEDALKTTTGMNIVRRGNYTQFQSRGFNINSITTNGLDSTISSLSGNNLHTGKQLTDTALYERVEVLRGGSGLKQAGSEPGGSVNAVLKRPTSQPLAEFEAQANRWGKVRGSADVSGVLSTEHGIRGRIVGVLERDRGFRTHDKGSNVLLFATADKSFGDNDKLTAGITYHYQTDTPAGFGLPSDNNGNDLRLPRDTFWGSAWDKGRYRKLHTFTEWEHRFNDDWKLTATADYKLNKSLSEQAQLSGARANVGSDDGTLPLDSFSRHKRGTRQWSARLELDGKYALFNQRHELYAAYTYSHEKFDIEMREQPTAGRSFNLHSWTGHEIPRPDWSIFDYRDYRNSRYTTHTATLANRFNFGRLHLIAGTGKTTLSGTATPETASPTLPYATRTTTAKPALFPMPPLPSISTRTTPFTPAIPVFSNTPPPAMPTIKNSNPYWATATKSAGKAHGAKAA